MIVVSDTTPLHYLVLVNAVDILPTLFGEVFAPAEVMRELQRSQTPYIVRRWAQTPPIWLSVKDPTCIDPANIFARPRRS